MSLVNIAEWIDCTEVEGPGKRFALWVQGCELKCPECCNPHMLEFSPKNLLNTEQVLSLIESAKAKDGIEGVTFLGGEPMLQAVGLSEIAKGSHNIGLSVMVFTGYLLEDLTEKPLPGISDLLEATDILVKQAGFYAMKTFEDFSFEEIRLPQDLSPEELKKASFVDEKKNLILYGNVGTGKTHLAQAIGLEACKQNKVVRFFRTAALVNRLSEAQKKSELNVFMKTLMKADLVICDEWGYVPLDRDGSKLLFQVISECYEQRSVIITTNLEFSKWVHIFYDEQMTSAMIDRLVHHSHLLLFEGQSFRIRNSLMKVH